YVERRPVVDRADRVAVTFARVADPVVAQLHGHAAIPAQRLVGADATNVGHGAMLLAVDQVRQLGDTHAPLEAGQFGDRAFRHRAHPEVSLRRVPAMPVGLFAAASVSVAHGDAEPFQAHIRALGHARYVLDGLRVNRFFVPEVHIERRAAQLAGDLQSQVEADRRVLAAAEADHDGVEPLVALADAAQRRRVHIFLDQLLLVDSRPGHARLSYLVRISSISDALTPLTMVRLIIGCFSSVGPKSLSG